MEFLVDGLEVDNMADIDVHSGMVSIFDLGVVHIATDDRIGRRQLDDDFPRKGRIPLLFCSCGDPKEGSFTVGLSESEGTVTWDQWAWEYDVYPSEWLPHLPTYHFPINVYEAALDEAAQTAHKFVGTSSSSIRAANLFQASGVGLNNGFVSSWLASSLSWTLTFSTQRQMCVIPRFANSSMV